MKIKNKPFLKKKMAQHSLINKKKQLKTHLKKNFKFNFRIERMHNMCLIILTSLDPIAVTLTLLPSTVIFLCKGKVLFHKCYMFVSKKTRYVCLK